MATSEDLIAAIKWRWPSARVDVRRGTIERWHHPQPAPQASEIERAVYDYRVRSAAQPTSIIGGLLRLNLAAQSFFTVPLTHDVQIVELLNPNGHGEETTATIIFHGNGVQRVVSWGHNVLWPNGVAPALSKNSSDVVRLYTWTAGETWYGRLLGANYKSTIWG